MPLKIFINNNGTFSDESSRLGLSATEGWWHTIAAKDLNGDGYFDFILGNHGLNSFFKASDGKPATMYVNDFDLNGTIEQIICTFNGDTLFPVVKKEDLVKQIPFLEKRYLRYADYRNQRMEDIFPPDVLERSIKLNARIMESCLMINSGKGSFKLTPLPPEAQFSPVYAISVDDFDHDGIFDIIAGGNQYRAKPETGIYDASYGLFLRGKPDGTWTTVSPLTSGLIIKGEIRDFKILNIKGAPTFVVARNNDNLLFYKY
jgi:hypothetical protein